MKKHTINLKWFKGKTIPQSVAKKDQSYLMKVLGELLQEGFSMNQSIQFTVILLPKYQSIFNQFDQLLERGESIERGLRMLGFSLPICAQLFYAQRQGRFIESLMEVSEQLAQEATYREKLIKILVYPCFLMIFLGGMLFGMRNFVLPHILSFISMETYENQYLIKILVNFFGYLPQITLTLLGVIILIYGLVDYFFLKKSAIERYLFLNRWPLIGRWSRQYATYKLAHQLGHFMRGGYSIQQIIQLIQDYPIDPFLTEVAMMIRQGMYEGRELTEILDRMNLFTEELGLVIYQGELTSQTAQKCKLYSQKVYQDLLNDIEKKMAFVQPILFIFVALLVLSMYLMMMLPMLMMNEFN